MTSPVVTAVPVVGSGPPVREDGTVTRTLLRGGHVLTPTPSLAGHHPTAVCVEDGSIVWIGEEDGAAGFVDGADRVVELGGRLVTPAFVDAHAHLAQTGLAAGSLDLSGTASLGVALDALASSARTSTDAVLLGFGWDETDWPEQRPPTREELDRASGDRRVYWSRVDVHSAVLSTAFLDACPDVVHAEGYDVSGLVARDAHHVARTGLFSLTPATDREQAVLRALGLAAAAGIGTVHELGAPHICPPTDLAFLAALEAAVAAGERSALPETVRYWGELGPDGVARARELGCEGAAGDLCMDGSIGSRTSALHAPYADAATTGHLYLDADQVRAHVVACTAAGLQAGFHVIGDRAVGAVVAGLQAAADELGRTTVVAGRHRLEHVEMASPGEMVVLAELGVTASMQPAFDAHWGGTGSLYAQRLGAHRALAMNALASMQRAGVALAFGSDTPVTPFDPWGAVRAASHHRTETERITPDAGFEAATRGGWRVARRDDGGTLEQGAPASLAVWDVQDPASGLPDLHPDRPLPVCAMTMVRGRVAFERAGELR